MGAELLEGVGRNTPTMLETGVTGTVQEAWSHAMAMPKGMKAKGSLGIWKLAWKK